MVDAGARFMFAFITFAGVWLGAAYLILLKLSPIFLKPELQGFGNHGILFFPLAVLGLFCALVHALCGSWLHKHPNERQATRTVSSAASALALYPALRVAWHLVGSMDAWPFLLYVAFIGGVTVLVSTVVSLGVGFVTTRLTRCGNAF